GDGPDKNLIRSKISELKLDDDVKVIPYQSNPFHYVSQAEFTLLTSRYEGFPMSVVESLAVGTPVIAVDCKSGPSEIIVDKVNGLLVPNHNVEALAEAIR